MPEKKENSCEVNLEHLIEIWKVLEMITGSMRRLGHYQLSQGEDAAKDAIHSFMGPVVFRKVANARTLIVSIIEGCDSNMSILLDSLAEDKNDIGYWEGPNLTDS